MNNFSIRLKELRTDKGLKQTEMSDKLNISTRGYQNYEIGQREPKIDVLIALADFFDVSLDYLVGRSDER